MTRLLSERQWTLLVHLSLLLVPVAVSLPFATVPPVDPDVISYGEYARESSWEQILTSTSPRAYRPVQILLAKALYPLWGAQSAPYVLLEGALLGVLALVIYRFFVSMAPGREAVAYGAAMLFALSTPALQSEVKAFQTETAAGICLYGVLLGMERLRGAPASGTRWTGLFLAAAVAMGGLLKETFMGMSPPVLGAYVFWRWRQRPLNGVQKAGLVWISAGYLLAAGLHVGVARGLAEVQPLRLPLSLLAYHSAVQFAFPFLFAGSAAIFLAALPRGRAWAGPALCALLLAAPLLLVLDYWGFVLFAAGSGPYLAFFFLLLLAGLGLRLARWDLNPGWFCSGAVLATLTAMMAFLFLSGLDWAVPFTRTYLLVLPLLFWLLADSLSRLWASPEARSLAERPSKRDVLRTTSARTVAAVLIAMVAYHSAAAAYNHIGRSVAEAAAINPVRQALAGEPLKDSVLRQVYDPWGVRPMELRGRGYSGPLPGGGWVMPDQPVSGDRSASATYYYVRKTGPVREFANLRESFPQDYLGFPAQQIAEFTYTRQTPLESSLAAAVRVEEKRVRFSVAAPWLEDTVARLFQGFPWAEEYEAFHGVYRVDGG